MMPTSYEIYTSSNGDSWRLVQEGEGGRLLVRHQANPSSGGQVTELEVGDFLARSGAGPEHAATRRILDSLARDTRPDDAGRVGG